MPSYFGLDIGSTSIKLVDFDGKKVEHIGIANNAIGKSVQAMNAAEKGNLIETIRKMVADSGVKKKQAVLSISESLVFSKVLKFPIMSTPELATAVKWELDQTVPFPPREAETSWSIVDKGNLFRLDNKVKVYVVAVPTKISDAYIEIADLAGIEAVRLENEIPPLIRAFSRKLVESEAVLVVDFGAIGTDIVCASKDTVLNNYFSPIGGNILTNYIANAFSLPVSQAEGYKRTYGIQKGQLDDKIFKVLKPLIDSLIGEINKMAVDFRNNYPGKDISRVVFNGGSAYLSGLLSYCTESLNGMEVVVGDVFSDISVEERFRQLGPVFSIAFGLSI